MRVKERVLGCPLPILNGTNSSKSQCHKGKSTTPSFAITLQMRHEGPPVLFFLGFGGSGYITIRKLTNIFKEITFIALNIRELNIKRKYEPKGNYVPIFYTLFQYLGWCSTEKGRKQPRKRQRTTHFSKAPNGFSSIQSKSQSLHYVYDALVDPPSANTGASSAFTHAAENTHDHSLVYPLYFHL